MRTLPILNIAALAVKQAWRHRRRTITIALCLLAGNAILLFQLAQGRGQQYAFLNNMINSLSGHVQISQGGGGKERSLFEANVQDLRPLREPERIEALLAADQRVLASTRRIRVGGMMSRDEENWSTFLVGVQPATERAVCDAIALDSGRFVVAGAKEIVISKTVARERGLRLGDTVTVLASTTSRSFNAMEFRIVGLLADTGLAKFYTRMAYVPIERTQQLIGLEPGQFYELVVRLRQTADSDAVAAQLRRTLGDAGGRTGGGAAAVKVDTWHDMAGLFLGILDVSKAFRAVMTGFLGLVILILVFSNFSVYVLERKREIATLLALGLRRAEVLTLFVGEAVFVAALAAGAGLALGAVATLWFERAGIPAFNEAMTYVFAGDRLFPMFRWADVLWLLVGSCAVAALAAWPPVRRSLRQDFVHVLNRDQ